MELFSKEQINNNSGGPKSLDMLLSLDEIEKDFSNLNFSIKQKIEREILEGSFHTGKSSVIQIFAIK